MNINKLKILLLCAITLLTACSFVDLDPQAKDIVVQNDSDALKNCESLGNISVSVWSKAETFQSQKTVEDQLDTLAKNQAASLGGNTIKASSEINNGQRTYNVYKCKPQSNSQ